MNKKVLTLCAGVLLSGMTVGTALAHTPEYRNTQVRSGAIASASTINHIQADKWYQLRTSISTVNGEVPAILVHVRDTQTGKVYLKAVSQDAATLLNSLWRIQYTNEDGVGGGKYTFVNKETGLELSFDHSWGVLDANGQTSVAEFNGVQEACNMTWEWYNNNKQTYFFAQVAPYAYTDTGNGEVLYMKEKDGFVYACVGSSDDVLDDRGVRYDLHALAIQPVIAESITLNPYAFNSMIDFNKTSMAQQAEFRFYKPNGDLLNPELQDKLVNGGVMDAGQEYKAEYNHSQIADIYQKALDELGVDVQLSTEAWVNAKNELAEAEEAEDVAIAAQNEASTTLTSAQNRNNTLKSQYEKAAETLVSLKSTIESNAKTVIGEYSYNFDDIKSEYQLTVKDGEDEAAAKSAADLAVKTYSDLVNSNAEAVLQLDALLKMNEAVSEFYSIYGPKRVQLSNKWSSWITAALISTDDVSTLTDACEPVYNKLVKYNKHTDGALKTAQQDYDEKTAVAEKATSERETKEQALTSAEQELNAAIGTENENAKYILTNEYMRLKFVEDNGTAVAGNQYLMVDTAFWQDNQVPSKSHLKLAHKTPKTTDNLAIAARYYFSIKYFPTQDSLVVSPLNASAIADANYKKTIWRTSPVGTRFIYASDIDQSASQASNTVTAGKEIAVKLDELNTSELCLTASPINAEEDSYLKARIAFNNPYDYLTRFKPEVGLYFIKSKNTGKYIVANYEGKLQYDVPEAGAQDYNDMPATMFVIERQGCDNGTRSLINNREYGKAWMPAFQGQLYEDKDGIYIIDKANYGTTFGNDQKLTIDDHFEFIKVEDEDALTSDKHGYQYLDPETLPYTEYSIHYNLNANDNIYLNVDNDNFVKGSEGANTYYELATVNPIDNSKTFVNVFGYAGGTDLPLLERQAYVLKVRDANLIDNDTTYVALVTENGQNEYYKAMGIKDIRAGKGQLAQFYLKADQVNEETKYYTLVDIRYNTYLADVRNGERIAKYVDANGFISHMDMDNQPSERLSAFALTVNDRPLYRKVTDATINLFNSSNEKLVETFDKVQEVNFLGYSKDNNKNGALAVEEVVTDNELRMPQYLLGFDKDTVQDGYWCNTNKHGYFESIEEAEAAAEDETHIVKYNGYTTGRYLVNFVDSVMGNEGSQAYNKVAKYTYKGKAVRLGFVEGVHMVITADEAKYINEFLGTKVAAGEYFFTLVGGHTLADLKNDQDKIIPERLFNDEYTKMNTYEKGKHNNWSFSFRLIDEDNEMADKFLVESNLPGVSSIGSMEGAWIKDISGCPVVSYIDGNHTTITASDLKKDNIRDGEVFTLEATDEEATANETIAAGNVVVAGVNGAVVVKGAEGKNVIVSTILGKVVVNEVVSSDNATIAAPAGIVVVSVDGESFKVVVK